MTNNKIPPHFDSLNDMAHFFDEIDTMVLEAEEADVKFVRAEQPDEELEQISIKLPKRDLAIVRAAAKEAGIGYTTYIRMILRNYVKKSFPSQVKGR